MNTELILKMLRRLNIFLDTDPEIKNLSDMEKITVLNCFSSIMYENLNKTNESIIVSNYLRRTLSPDNDRG